MIPLRLHVQVCRVAGKHVVEIRTLLVTHVANNAKGNDWIVSVWWGGGRSEVDFSLRHGKILRAKGSAALWALGPTAASEILQACSSELKPPPIVFDA
jgi:hypothetical protein